MSSLTTIPARSRTSTRIGRGGGGRIEDALGREGEGGRTGRHEGGGSWVVGQRDRVVGREGVIWYLWWGGQTGGNPRTGNPRTPRSARVGTPHPTSPLRYLRKTRGRRSMCE